MSSAEVCLSVVLTNADDDDGNYDDDDNDDDNDAGNRQDYANADDDYLFYNIYEELEKMEIKNFGKFLKLFSCDMYFVNLVYFIYLKSRLNVLGFVQ